MTADECVERKNRNMKYINPVKIVQLRLTRGYTITDLSSFSGVPYKVLREIETCQRRMAGLHVSIPELLAIANTLQCDLFALLAEEYDLTAHVKIYAMISLARNMKRYAVPPISVKNHQKAKVQRTIAANKARAE